MGLVVIHHDNLPPQPTRISYCSSVKALADKKQRRQLGKELHIHRPCDGLRY